MKRRKFIQYTGLAAGFTLGSIPVLATNRPEYEHLIANNDDNILVIIQLFGGNDGLNTIVPINDSRYYSKYRPKTGVAVNKTVKLNDDIYLNNALAKGKNEGLFGLYKQGKLSVIQGVGYENPNLSHFRSTDIWLSGIMPANDSELLSTGWVGRFAEKIIGNTLPEHPVCMNIGNSSSLLFQGIKGETAISVENPNDFYERGKDILSGNSALTEKSAYADEHNFIIDLSIQSNKYSTVVKKAFDAGKNVSNYEENKLSNELKLVARLIAGGLKSKMYLVSIDGFDTHANQGSVDGKHGGLLQSISQAVGSFMDDLKQQGVSKKVVGMTVSEFGRRPEENASLGTDHGAASVMFVFGDEVSGKIYGKSLSFDNLNSNKDFQYQYDYRRIYDDVLTNWFKADDQTVKSIINKRYERIENGLFASTQVLSVAPEVEIKPSVFPNPTADGIATLRFILKQNSSVEIKVNDMTGRIVNLSPNLTLPDGEHQIPIFTGNSAGQYLVSLRINEVVQTIRLIRI